MPLFWLALAFLAGVLLAANVHLLASTWLILAGSTVIGVILLAILSRWLAGRMSMRPPAIQRVPYPFSPAFVVLLSAAAFFGGWRYQSKQPDLSDPGFIASYNLVGEKAILEGVIAAPPDVRDTYTNLRVSVDKIRLASDSTYLYRDVSGLLLVQAPPGETWRYGDRVHAEGKIEIPPEVEEFSYREYLARQGIYSRISWATVQLVHHGQGSPVLAFVYRLKERALATVYGIFPDPEASLLAGILLGIESGIPPQVQEAFKATGTSHIIAISG